MLIYGTNRKNAVKKLKTTSTMTTTTATRPLYEIAKEIKNDWRDKTGKPNVYFGAKPYLDAMQTLDKVSDNYGMDSGKSIVLYFLANAQTWRGDNAKRIKAELKKLAGVK
jgi:hypothetical protein